MADYDWFNPSPAQLEKERGIRKWQDDNKVNVTQTSTAVETKFYVCLECGTIIAFATWAVISHRAFYHSTSAKGKHRADYTA